MRAPTAAHTADRSSDGSAWQSAPPIVPRLRTTGSAITRSASVKIGEPAREQLGLQQRPVARHRADADLAVGLAHVAELGGQRVDVDQVLRARRGAASSSAAASGRPRAAARPARVAPAARARARRSSRARSRTPLGPAGLTLLDPTSPLDAHLAGVRVSLSTSPKRSLRPRRRDRDPGAIAVVRARRPSRVGQGGRGRARGDRAGGLGRGRRAAQGARRRAVRAQRPRDRADPGRAAAGRAGRRDPRPGRAGAPLGGRQPRRMRGRGHERRSPSTSARCSTRSRRATRASRSPSSRRRAPRSPTCSSTGGPTSRSARRPGRRHDRRGAVPALPAGRSSPRPGHPLAGRRALAPADARRRALAGRPARARPDDRHRPVLRPPRARAGRGRGLREPRRRRARRRGRRRGHRARARPRRVDEVRRRARAPRRARHADRRALAREHARRSAARCPPALALQRFATTPDATQAIATGRAGTAQGARAPEGARDPVGRIASRSGQTLASTARCQSSRLNTLRG